MIADIATGNTGASDVFMLIAVVLAVVAAIAALVRQAPVAISHVLGWLALACTALALLLL